MGEHEAGVARASAEIVPARIGLHELRHCYESYLDAAGIPETRQKRHMGHRDDSITARYRHALPGQLEEDARRLDAYLTGAVAGKVPTLTGAQAGAQKAKSA